VRPRVVAALLAVATVLASGACGGGHKVDFVPNCEPTTTDLHITARNTQFDTGCLAVAAETPFKIVFENHDPGVPHTISIYTVDPSRSSNAELLFEGDRVQGPAITTYDVPALPAGIHFFRCEVHPTVMFGNFIVQA